MTAGWLPHPTPPESLRERLQAEARKAADSKDLALIDEQFDELNAEAEDVLTYQGEV